MGGQQRIYKQRIASTTTLAKVFRAMEMIAASRIGAARRAATEAGPYEKALTQAVAAGGGPPGPRPSLFHILRRPPHRQGVVLLWPRPL